MFRLLITIIAVFCFTYKTEATPSVIARPVSAIPLSYVEGAARMGAETDTTRFNKRTASNLIVLRQGLKRDPADWELYLAHQFGGISALHILKHPSAQAVNSPTNRRAITEKGGTDLQTNLEFANQIRDRFTLPASALKRPQPAATGKETDHGYIGGKAKLTEQPIDSNQFNRLWANVGNPQITVAVSQQNVRPNDLAFSTPMGIHPVQTTNAAGRFDMQESMLVSLLVSLCLICLIGFQYYRDSRLPNAPPMCPEPDHTDNNATPLAASKIAERGDQTKIGNETDSSSQSDSAQKEPSNQRVTHWADRLNFDSDGAVGLLVLLNIAYSALKGFGLVVGILTMIRVPSSYSGWGSKELSVAGHPQ